MNDRAPAGLVGMSHAGSRGGHRPVRGAAARLWCLLRFAVADARHSWRMWMAMAVTTSAVAAALVAAAALSATVPTLPGGRHGMLSASSVGGLSVINTVLCVIVGLAMIHSCTNQVALLREREIAGWQLVGLLPGQAARVFLGQSLLVTLAALLPGVPLGMVVAAGWLTALAGYDGAPVPGPVIPAGALGGVAATLLTTSLLGSLGAIRRIRRAGALSVARVLPRAGGARLTWPRAVLALAAVGGAAAATIAAERSSDLNVVAGALFGVLCLLTLAVAALAPWLLVGGHRAWSALVPARLVAAWLARASLRWAPRRLVAAALPISFVAFLPGGVQLLFNSLRDSLIASTGQSRGTGAPVGQLLLICGVPAAIALVGAAMALVGAAQRRDAELALVGLAGATPALQVRRILAEALSVTVTGVLGAAVPLIVLSGALVYGAGRVMPRIVVTVPGDYLVGCLVVATLVTFLAALAPAVPALRQPPQRVHAATT